MSVGDVSGNESSVSVEQCTINRTPRGEIEPLRGHGGHPAHPHGPTPVANVHWSNTAKRTENICLFVVF